MTRLNHGSTCDLFSSFSSNNYYRPELLLCTPGLPKKVLKLHRCCFSCQNNCKTGVNHIFMHYSFQPRIFSKESKITELNFGCKLQLWCNNLWYVSQHPNVRNRWLKCHKKYFYIVYSGNNHGKLLSVALIDCSIVSNNRTYAWRNQKESFHLHAEYSNRY